MNTLSKMCREMAEKNGYAPFMNNTKWRELCFAFSSLDSVTAWRTKDLINGHVSDWDCEWYHHVGPDYCAIEWLEIDPRDCQRDKVFEILTAVGVTYEDGVYPRVIGYR